MSSITLTKKGYLPRIVDSKVDEMMKAFGAVCIGGPKWCGKIWVSLNHSESVMMIGDPAGNFQNKRLIQIDLSYAFDGKKPHLIDEWQEIPELWDATRSKVDESNECGNFILTGSSIPILKGISHSGAGRIGRIKMSTMSLFESGDSDGAVSLRSLFNSTFRNTAIHEVDLDNLIYLSIRGGWPNNIGKDEKSSLLSVRGYIETIIEDASRLDGKLRDTEKISMTLKSLARNESTLATTKKLVSDIIEPDEQGENLTDEECPSGESPSYVSVRSYLDILGRLFVIDDQPAFNPNLRSSARVKKMSKRHLTDPSLAIAAMHYTHQMLRNDLNTFGFIFEALCERDLKIYAESINGRLYHYHDDSDREIDAVVELDDGRWGAFEIKLGAKEIEEGANSLISIDKWMKSVDIKNPPSFLCVICGMSNAAYRRDDGVFVVPITSLRD